MANTIKIKRGLKANLSKANLQPGEMAFATDTKELYVSDTTTPINANTTYSISKSGSTITLTGSDGSTSTVSDSNTTYSAASTTANGLMSSADKTKLNGIATGAEVNQNAFSSIVVGSTTISADAKTDTLTMVAGSNITLTPDATNDKITIAATDTTYGNATTSAAGLMTAAMVTKLNGIATGANKTTVDTSLSSSSTNPVQNKVIYNALAGKAATSAIPTKTSQLTNDSDYATKEYVNSLAGNAGIKYKVVNELPTANEGTGERVSIENSVGMDLSGAKLFLNIQSGFALGQTNEEEIIVEGSNGFIKVTDINGLARIAAHGEYVLYVEDSQQNITKLYSNSESILVPEYTLPSDFGTVLNITYNDVIQFMEVELAQGTPEEGIIYLVSSESSYDKNVYDEYMWIAERWEFIGSTSADLSQYATKEATEAQINSVNQKLDTNIEENEAEFNAIDANMVNLTEQISDLRSLINVGGVSGLENATVSIDDSKLQVGSDDSAAQVKSDGNTFEILTNGETSVKADGEKLYANNISTNGYIDAGAHRQQIFEISGEIRTGWFYTGGVE